MKPKSNNSNTLEGVERRLDAIIRLLVEARQSEEEEFNFTSAVVTLNSAGLTPTEIAHIFGKKSATDIAPYLYGKGSKKNKVESPEPLKES